MLRKDYLGKQLEQLSVAIAKLISEIAKKNINGDASSAIDLANEFSKTEFDISIEEIIAMDSEQVLSYLTTNKKLSTARIDLLADLLFATTNVYEKCEKKIAAKSLYQKILKMYEHVNEADKTFSLNRQEKITILKSKI
jgi:hypothetical protein